jgi:hypothetical protein
MKIVQIILDIKAKTLKLYDIFYHFIYCRESLTN